MPEIVNRQDEVSAKLRTVRDVVGRRGAAAAALTARRNFAWATAGGDNHVVSADQAGVATLLVTADSALLVTTVIEAPRIYAEELAELDLEVITLPWWDATAVAEAISEHAGGPVLDDAALEEELRPLRSRLSEPEIDRLRILGQETSRAMTGVFGRAARGDDEAALAARLPLALAPLGIATPVLLSARDERIVRFRHPVPKPGAVERSFMLIVVAERGGLQVAMTRIGWFDGRPDEETLRRYRACARVDAAMRDATVAGRTLGDVFDAAVVAYGEVGYPDEWRLHHQGGTIAYQPRETLAVPGSRERIDPGMAFAFNPSITGAKVEDTFVLAPDGRREIVTRDLEWPTEADGSPRIWVAAQ